MIGRGRGMRSWEEEGNEKREGEFDEKVKAKEWGGKGKGAEGG